MWGPTVSVRNKGLSRESHWLYGIAGAQSENDPLRFFQSAASSGLAVWIPHAIMMGSEYESVRASTEDGGHDISYHR